jgi:glyceraldehyde 3-phosphate dehydrogenase
MTMVTGMGINGFGRIGRLVTRIIMEDESCDLKAINAGSATPDYMAYQSMARPNRLLKLMVTTWS